MKLSKKHKLFIILFNLIWTGFICFGYFMESTKYSVFTPNILMQFIGMWVFSTGLFNVGGFIMHMIGIGITESGDVG